ncbi:MAG: OmpA family protein [Spongiibacteraceae bacterium]|nr:OmpA family protein [Spongiibacteraceae bacterium]
MSISTQAAFAQYTEAKQVGAFFTSTIAGAALGGPVGLIAGAIGGAWLSEELKQADTVDRYQRDLSQASQQLINLKSRLQAANHVSEKYAKMAVDQLELQMLFKTNRSELTPSGIERINQVADFLSTNPEISIQLDGYADPRGSNDENLLLSQERVAAIVTELEEYGLDPQRIVSYSHGASLSQATEGDYDAYALERVVKIKLFHSTDQSELAQSFVAY